MATWTTGELITDEKLNNIENALTSLQADITALEGWKTNEVDGELYDLNGATTALQETVASLESLLSSLNTRMNTLPADLSGYQNTIDIIYPVGSLYISTSNVNPATFLGGTWELYSTNRFLLGAASSAAIDPEELEGGNSSYTLTVENLPPHTHAIGTSLKKIGTQTTKADSVVDNKTQTTTEESPIQTAKTGGNTQTGITTPIDIMPPFIRVYIWKRLTSGGSNPPTPINGYVPSGGTTGQVFTKASDLNFDAGWSNLPVATNSTVGVMRTQATYGLNVNSAGIVYISGPSLNNIKAGTDGYKAVTLEHQHEATFYGLAKAAGDATQSASSNVVGAYTEDAKIAIQKMLGIYEAPWELIREDTFTNATEDDHIITVDGNGQPFELTDLVLMFETPKQETYSAKGTYGQIRYHYGSGSAQYRATESVAWTQDANANSHGTVTILIQDGPMLFLSASQQAAAGGSTAWRYRYGADFPTTSTQPGVLFLDAPESYSKVTIMTVTGTGHYKLYGKRKWTE